jgi:hypothetical protein
MDMGCLCNLFHWEGEKYNELFFCMQMIVVRWFNSINGNRGPKLIIIRYVVSQIAALANSHSF